MSQINFYNYTVTYPFGFIGHACSLLTFSARQLRATSTGLLFLLLTIFDLMYLLMTIYDFITVILQLPIVPNAHLCRFRTFTLGFSSVMSSWLLVLIGLDRLIRARFPYHQARLCTLRTASCAATVVCVCSILLTCHELQSEFAFSDPTMRFCGPSLSSSTAYATFYFNVWPSLQLCMTYFIPACMMAVCVMGIRLKLGGQRIIVAATIRRERVQRHMLILMISSVGWFAFCTLPCSILRAIIIQSRGTPINSTLIEVLTAFMTMNYCFNFYINCLTSQLFRKTFVQQLKRLFHLSLARQNNLVQPLRKTIGTNGIPTANP